MRAHVQGAGTITYSFSGPCDMTWNQNERASQYCGQRVQGGWGEETGRIWATPASEPKGEWVFLEWENCPNPDGSSCSMTSPTTSAGTFSPKAIFVDVRAPVITLGDTTYPGDRAGQVDFTTAGNPETWECQLDRGAWGACHTPTAIRFGGLSEGPHLFRVRSADFSGQLGYSEERQVTVVDTSLIGPLPGLARSRAATFRFGSGEGREFRCQLDAGPWTACESPHTVTVPADGAHQLSVQAWRGASAYDPAPATHTWQVDTQAPETSLDPLVGPGADTAVHSPNAAFAFSGSEPATTFECRLDGGAWEPCAGSRSLTGLSSGRHTFEVRATDAAGNVDETAAARSWIAVIDGDGDGDLAGLDCDDTDPGVHHLATEILDNAVDENCDDVLGENRDRDGDGHEHPAADCDDADPAVHRSAVEIPGNGVDEDCVRGPQPWPRMSARVMWTAAFGATRTTFRDLSVSGFLARSTITVRCAGPRCPIKRLTLERATGRTRLKAFIGRRMAAGTRLEIRVTRPGYVGSVHRLAVRRGRMPAHTVACLAPDARRPGACPR